LSTLLQQQELNEQQIWGTWPHPPSRPQPASDSDLARGSGFAPVAASSRSGKSAAAVMGMNNIYYRFQHWQKTQSMPPCRPACA